MVDQHYLNLLKQGKDIWNQWRQEHPDRQPDLSSAYLRRINLTGIYHLA